MGNLYKCGVKGYNEVRGRVYSPNGISVAVRAVSGGGDELKIAVEPRIGAIRGRYK